MVKRKIFLHGMRFINTQPKINAQSDQRSGPTNGWASSKEDNNNKKENLTKDRKIKLDKIIKSSGFKEI